MPRKRKAALILEHLALLHDDLRIHEFQVLRLVTLGHLSVLRQVTLIQADEHAAHHSHLRARQAVPLCVGQRLDHVVQQLRQTVVKVCNGTAFLFQDWIAVLYDSA